MRKVHGQTRKTRIEYHDVDIQEFGEYRRGLTSEEITEYLKQRTGSKYVKRLRARFCKVAGCNTMAVGPQGQSLMYRWDVERFADVVLLGKPTYFD